jgi:septal ring factor EnvC (AmiA/AmiB activator)
VNRVISGLTLLVFLAAAAPARDADPWESPDLDAEALTAARDAAKELGDKPEAKRRMELLDRLLESLALEKRLPDVAKAPDRLAEAQEALKRAREAPAEEVPERVETEEQLEEIQKPWKEARGRLQAATESLKKIEGDLTAFEDEVKDLPAGATEAQRRLDAAGEGTDPYLLGNLRLELRERQVRQGVVQKALAALRAEKPIVSTQIETVKVREKRLRRRYDAASEVYAEWLKQQAAEQAKEAKRKAAEAEREKDPLRQLEAKVEQEIASLAAEGSRFRSQKARWATTIANEERSLQRVSLIAGRIQTRIDRGRIDRDAAEVLRTTREHLAGRRKVLLTQRIPEIDRVRGEIQAALARAQDRLWRAESDPTEDPAYRSLLEGVGAERAEELDRVWGEYVGGKLLSALQDHAVFLDDVEGDAGRLEELYTQEMVALEDLSNRIASSLYFIRSDPPLDGKVFLRALRDVKAVSSTFLRGTAPAFRLRLTRTLLLLAAGIGVLVVGFLLRRWLRPGPRAEGPVTALRALRTLLAAAIPPIQLLALAQLTIPLELREGVQDALVRWFRLSAVVLAILAFIVEILREDGVAVARKFLKPEVASQILGSARIFVLGYVVFMVPANVLHQVGHRVEGLPRLLETAFFLTAILAMSRLLLRRGPILRNWFGVGSGAYRAWGLIGPLLILLLFTIFALDLAGYRVGAAYLFRGALRTLILFLALGVVYRFLARGIRRLAERASRTAGESEKVADRASEISEAVLAQLTRMAALGLILVALLVLGDSWDFGERIAGLLRYVVLTQSADGTILTLWGRGDRPLLDPGDALHRPQPLGRVRVPRLPPGSGRAIGAAATCC